MKILEVRDGFIKFETSDNYALSTFIEVKGINKRYIGQVIQVKHAGDKNIVYAKFLYLYDGLLHAYDKTSPSVDSEIFEFPFNELSKSYATKDEISIGVFADCKTEVFTEKDSFDKKTLVSIDSPELAQRFTKGISRQFDNYLIIDTLGIFDGKKSIAGTDFKLPLNTDSLEFMFEDCLSDATSDSKSLIKDIFQDLADYSKTVPFVPFGALKTIVDDMVNKSHVFKLLVLKNKLAKFDKLGYFAATASEAENLNKILATNGAIIDLSKLDTTFQNRYLSVIYAALEKQQNKPQFFITASNAINKKILKKILLGALSSTFITHSRFKYINEIKALFDNFIIEPSFVNRDNFKTYSAFINSMDKDSLLVINKSTDSLPLIITPKDEEPEIIEINVEESGFTDQDALELEEALDTTDPTIEAINKKSEDLIEKVSEEVVTEPTQEGMALFADDEDMENDNENIDSNLEILIEPTTDQESSFDNSLEETSEKATETVVLENELEDNTPETNSELLEELEQNLVEETEIETLSSEDKFEDFHTQIDEIQTIEIPEEISDMAEEAEAEQNEAIENLDVKMEDSNIADNDEENQDHTEIVDVMPLENDDEEFDMIVELDDNEISEDAIVIDFEDDENSLENDALDKEIVEDVDKVFTTMKEDSISDSDLDFIDELNEEMEEPTENYTLPEGMEELTELEETDMDEEQSFLEPLEEINEFVQEETLEEKEILETRNSSTPIVPVYDADIPSEDMVTSDTIEQGDTVIHAKYGNGVVEKMIKYGTKTLYSINFDNVGRRLLDPTLTEIKKA